MSKELNNIGEIFRETLKNHRLETDTDLWVRLDSQLASQTQIVSPKTSLIKSLPLLKVAAAATLVVSIALAYNYIYIPYVSDTKPINTQQKFTNENTSIITDTAQISQKIETKNDIIVVEENNKIGFNPKHENSDKIISKKNATENLLIPKTSNPIINNYANINSNQGKTNDNKAEKSVNKNITDSLKANNDNDKINQNIQDTKITEPDHKQNYQSPDNEIYDLLIPNVFTPNFDGVNDYFVIKNIDKYINNQLIITNRTGKVVYEKINYQNSWDASNVPDGVYYYVLKCRYKNNDFVKMGMLTIVR